ncbi:MFS general substrate transporter [Gonapodya prolifera JEL478]|uniref:MFS general substrate transporter n=1 Tax=Gonapodya prolifera (strain JEL478) TaxID=1344416 RepID=A0A139AHI0_GONPJ|nr:MFS general substrate transporter [Gonapodya prolifera JEL478]|eukprot:KXS16281.1 MFS general substrate transporter [Gonapodya prolifera JEL478]
MASDNIQGKPSEESIVLAITQPPPSHTDATPLKPEPNLDASDLTLAKPDNPAPDADTAIKMDLPDSADSTDSTAKELTGKDASSPESPDEIQNSPRMIALAVLALAVGMAVAALDGTFVATMLPTIARDLNGADSYQWVGTGYLLTSTALAPVWGKLSDIFGRKQLLMLLMLEFIIFSALCALSNSMIMLIMSRIFQGVGGGAIQSLTFVVIGEIVAPLERGKYMGIMAGITGLCAVIGPFIGGVITDNLSWRWGFWINIPVGVMALIAYQLALKLPRPPGSLRSQFRRVDYLGVFLCTTSISVLLLACTWGGVTYPWASGQVLGTIAVGLVLLVAFVWWEARAGEPVVPLSLFRDKNYIFTNVVLFFVGWAMYGLSYFLPVYFQDVLGLSPTGSGVMNIPLMVFLIPSSFIAGIVTMKTGKYVRFPQLGMALVSIAMGLFTLLDENSPKWMQVVPQVLCGIGFGITMSTGQLMAQTNAPDHMIGPATTVSNFLRSLGGVMGIAVFATVMQNLLTDHAASGIASVAREYRLNQEQIQTFGASLTAQYSGAKVDLSSIPALALAALQLAIKQAYVVGIRYAFISCIPFCILGFLGALFVKHVPLRRTAAVQMSSE